MISFMLDRLLDSTESEMGISSSSSSFSMDSSMDWDRLRLFPDLLVALSNALEHLVGDIPNAKAIRLERILVKFFLEFPNVFPSHTQAGFRG